MQKNRAFTLIELLVVIAIIALLLSVLIPALQYVKMQATGVVCSAHNRGLAQAWHAYSEDNEGRICGGHTNNDSQWIGNPRTANGTWVGDGAELVSLEDEIRGFQAGTLWQYVENYKIYHCPGDGKWESLQRGYRTTSIQGMMNGESDPAANAYAVKMTDIISPSDKFVFIENVDPRGWNKGSWIMNAGDIASPRWIDPIAVFHAERSTFGFADGHAEKHRWLGKLAGATWQQDQTIPWAKKATTGDNNFRFAKPVNWGTPEEDDIRWLARGYVPGR